LANVPAVKFEQIYREHRRRVLRYLLRRVDSPALAEDLTADTFLVAWRRLDDVPEEPLPWLLGTARRLLANHRRSVQRRPPARPLAAADGPDPMVGGDDLADRVSEKEAFSEGFAKLSEPDREVLTLVAWDGLKPREAAEVLDTTPQRFSLRLHRARRRLAKQMTDSGHPISPGDEQRGEDG
jgi:RNA polymerase sigma-70 factor, ECF subfamily